MATEVEVHKATGYVAIGPPATKILVQKATAYVAIGPIPPDQSTDGVLGIIGEPGFFSETF